MPIWLRNFTFSRIKSWYDKEVEASKQNTNPNSSNILDSSGKINPPNFKQKTSYK